MYIMYIVILINNNILYLINSIEIMNNYDIVVILKF